MNFLQKLNSSIEKNNSLVCIGLDTDIDKIPKHLLTGSDPVFTFNKAIIDATADLVCCYKINIAFYSAREIEGLKSLQTTIQYIHHQYTSIPVILDAKRADTGNTAEHYVKEVFDVLKADAVTVNPYLGFDSIEPFLKRGEKGIIVLCRTSNPGASDFQDIEIGGEPLYLKIARKVVSWNEKYKNCLLVVGATWAEELKRIRKIAPSIFFLVPGIGPQGGDLEKTLQYGLTKEKSGLLIHSARAIIYASSGESFANAAKEEAEKLRDKINQFRA